MQFKEGDIVRYKSEIQPMTVTSLYNNKVYCVFFDNEKKEIVINAVSEALEYVPEKALKKLAKKQNQTGLKAYFDNHPVIIYLSMIVIGFCSGFSAKTAIMSFENEVPVKKESFVYKTEMGDIINKDYIRRNEYDELKVENERLNNIIMNNSKNDVLIKKINDLINERERIRSSLTDIRSRNSPLQYSSEKNPISTEEQDALDKITEISNEISVLYSKL